MAMLGHVSAEMSLRYGRLFDATVRADYETRPHPGQVPARPRAAANAPRCRSPTSPAAATGERHRDDQGPARRRLLPAHRSPRRLRLRQHLRALPELPHRHRPSCRSSPPNAPTPPPSPPTPNARGWGEEASPPPRPRRPARPAHEPRRPTAHDRPSLAVTRRTGLPATRRRRHRHHLRRRRRPRRHRPRHPLPPTRTPRHHRRTPPTRPRRAHPHRPGQSRSTSSAPPWKPSPPRSAATKKNSDDSNAEPPTRLTRHSTTAQP